MNGKNSWAKKEKKNLVKIRKNGKSFTRVGHSERDR